MENPLLGREFITHLRTRKAIAFGIVFVCSLSGIVMLMWPSSGSYSLASQSSKELFMLLSMGQLLFVSLFSPAFTAVCITTEKERETYQLLYHTLLTPGQIIFGKMAAGLGLTLILMLGSLPAMGACFILGGVGITDVLMVYAVLIGCAIFFGLLGMMCSALYKTSYTALIMCYVYIILLSGITWVPSIILGSWAIEYEAVHLIRGLSPFAAMVSIINPGIFASEHVGQLSGVAAFADTALPFLSFAGVGSVAVLVRTIILIARPPQPKRRNNELVLTDNVDIGRKLRFPFYIFDPARRKKMIGPIFNIIAVKEMRTKAFARSEWLIRAMYFSVVIALVLAFLPLFQVVQGEVPIPTIILVCLSLPLGVILLVGPVLTSSAISSEKECGIFEALRMTTAIGPWKLVMGKLQVSWFFILLLLCSTFPTFFMLAYLSAPAGEMEKITAIFRAVVGIDFATAFATLKSIKLSILTGIFHALLVALVSMAFATIVGIFTSTIFRKSSTATSVSYGIIIAFALGTLIPYFMSENLPHWLVELFVTINPFAAAGKAASGEVFRELDNNLWLDHIKIMGGVCLFLLFSSIVRVWWMMKPGK
jgi:ABC-type transport system involved in multi-copper enzyme maturation permease subunit